MTCRTLILPLLLLPVALAAAPATSGPTTRTEWTLRDGASPALQGLIDRQPQVRPAAIQRLQASLDAARKVAAEARGPDAKPARERVGELMRAVSDLRAHEAIATDAPMDQPQRIEVGWAGAVLDARLRCRVLRVVDERDAVVDVIYDVQVGDVRRPMTIEKSVTFWLADVPTAGWADGGRVELPAMLLAAGTRDGGAGTLIELRPFTQADFVHHDDAPRQPDQKPPYRRP